MCYGAILCKEGCMREGLTTASELDGASAAVRMLQGQNCIALS